MSTPPAMAASSRAEEIASATRYRRAWTGTGPV
jgi:hypothetical protein